MWYESYSQPVACNRSLLCVSKVRGVAYIQGLQMMNAIKTDVQIHVAVMHRHLGEGMASMRCAKSKSP